MHRKTDGHNNSTKSDLYNGLWIKTRNTRAKNGMREMEGMLHSGEFHQTFLRMLPNITGNDAKHAWKCHQTFLQILANILGRVAKHSGVCP